MQERSICGAYSGFISIGIYRCAFYCSYIAYPGLRRSSLPGIIDILPFHGMEFAEHIDPVTNDLVGFYLLISGFLFAIYT